MKLSGALSARAKPSVAQVSGAQRPKAIVGPKSRPIRNAITSLHRWFGLAAAGWLFGIALTGSIITFNHEIDALLNPDLFVASSKGPVAPLLADAERRTGAGKINFLLYVHDAHGLVTMGTTRDDGQSAELFYDSGNGRFNGERTTSSYGLGNRAFMRTAYRLHHTFLGWPGARSVSGSAGACLGHHPGVGVGHCVHQPDTLVQQLSCASLCGGPQAQL